MRGICLLAEAAVDLPLSDTLKTVLGLLGVMALGVTVLTFVLLVKKVFGRTPPLEDDLKKLRSEIYKESGGVKKELSLRLDGVENEIEEIKVDRERKWIKLTNEIHALELRFATMTGRIEAVLKKLEEK